MKDFLGNEIATNTIYRRLKSFRIWYCEQLKSKIKNKLATKNKIKADLRKYKVITRLHRSNDFFGTSVDIVYTEIPICKKNIKENKNEKIIKKLKEVKRVFSYCDRIKDKIKESKENNFIHRMKMTLQDRADINKSISSFFLKNEKNHPKLSSLLFDLEDTYIFPEQYIRFFEISKDFYTMKLNINEKYEKEAIEYSHEGWFRGAFLILKDITKTMTEETKEKLENKNNDAFIELNQNEITKDVIDYCNDNNLDISAIYRKCIVVIYDRDYYDLMTY